ncbi:MAG: GDP-L-fucose synthase, partial [bacterium]|nr:GDP-L-fucose synthase [bacterium]
RYPVPDPVNLGTDEEVSIAHLIQRILDASGMRAELVFDVTKPDGSPRRQSDNEKAEKHLGFKATTRFAEGLQRTIAWYRAHVRSRVPA